MVGHGGARTRACSAAAVSAGLRPCAVWSFAPDSVAGSVQAARGEGSAVRGTEAYAAGCRAWQVQLWAMGRAALSYGWGASSGRFYPIWRTGAAVTLVDQGLLAGLFSRVFLGQCGLFRGLWSACACLWRFGWLFLYVVPWVLTRCITLSCRAVLTFAVAVAWNLVAFLYVLVRLLAVLFVGVLLLVVDAGCFLGRLSARSVGE